MTLEPRCRFAPTTSGPAHPGTLLAGLLCWLDARSRAAHLELRLEDIDSTRCTPESARDMRAALDWCDRHFGRGGKRKFDKLPFPYTFEGWLAISGEVKPDMKALPVRQWKAPETPEEWPKKAADARKRIDKALGFAGEDPQLKALRRKARFAQVAQRIAGFLGRFSPRLGSYLTFHSTHRVRHQ